jgi:hypothetical protein
MSDMIDGLSRAAIDAGQDASRNLTSSSALAVMRQQVNAGRRKRRIRAGVVAGGALAMVLATAIVVPRLDLGPEAIDPADTVRSVVSSVGNLTVFNDGSMSLYTQRGTFVDLPAVTGEENVFGPVSPAIACEFDPSAAEPGWVFHVDDARQVLLFARPQVVMGMERRLTTQGEFLGLVDSLHYPYPAFTMDAEVATAPQLAIRERIYEVYVGEGDYSGSPVKSVATLLDASPKVTISGDADSPNRVATIEARAVGNGVSCDKGFSEWVYASGENVPIRRYLLADIFLLDREGNSMLLATHTSWTGLEFKP